MNLPRSWMGAVAYLALACGCLADEPAATKKGEGPFVVKPYLQIGSAPAPDRMQVLWHGEDADAPWAVEYRVKGREAWSRAELAAHRRVAVAGFAPHRIGNATLAGLAPGMPFEYRVLRDGKPVFSAEGMALKAETQPYRFVAFGDCGAGTPEQKPLGHRAYLAKPDLVVIPGDIVYEHGTVAEYHEKFWPAYNADEASPSGGVPMLRSIPFVAAPGNHDTDARDLNRYPDGLAYFLNWDQPLNGPPAREGNAFVPVLAASQASRDAFLSAAGKAYPGMTNFSFHYGNAHWTIVDSNPYVDWTDKVLVEWVRRDLESARSATWRFVVFHHPGFNSAREHFEQQQMRLLAPVFEAGKVDVVFNGHVHNYQRSYPMQFQPDNKGTLLVGGRDGKTIRGRVVNGLWKLDKAFDGRTRTTPEGVIYLVTGAGGQHLYNPEQHDLPDSWQGFTHKFVSKVHTITIADVDGPTLKIRQVTADGTEVDQFTLTKPASARASGE